MIDTTAAELTLTEILEITLTNGVKGYFTCYSKPLVYGSNTYLPIPPGSPQGWRTPITYHTDLQVDKVKFSVGIISVTVGTTKTYTVPQIIRRGFLRNAWCKLSLIDWASLSTVARPLFEGPIGDDIGYNGEILTFSISSLLDLLDTTLPQIVYSEFCQHHSTRADADTYLFGRYCGLVKSAWKSTGTALANTTPSIIYASVFAYSNFAAGYFAKGEIKFTSGNNTDVRRTIRMHGDGYVTLVVKFPESIAIGNAFDCYPGCDKLRATCNTRFANTANCYDAPNVPKQQDLVFG